MQMQVHKGRGNYEPNTIDPQGPRETSVGLRTAPIELEGTKVRLRAESFRDHYCQAPLFYRSVTPQEQKHMAMAPK
jgi:catalase